MYEHYCVENGCFSGNHLLLDKELFEYTKPGLSSFSKEPHKVICTVYKETEG